MLENRYRYGLPTVVSSIVYVCKILKRTKDLTYIMTDFGSEGESGGISCLYMSIFSPATCKQSLLNLVCIISK